jgi:hypothetical protein
MLPLPKLCLLQRHNRETAVGQRYNRHVIFPRSVGRYFWGDNLSEISLEKHAKYITQTLLETGDTHAIRWLFSVVPPQIIKAMLPELRLSRKSAHFWKVYLS